MRAEDLYLAFADGALTWDCAPCGRCCRGLGFGGEAEACRRSPLTGGVAAFLAAGARPGPLATYFTYADGCRFHGEDGRCDVHRDLGRDALPLLCRLFPFTRLVDVDGLWAVLPHGSCPWRARVGSEAAPGSAHRRILDDLARHGSGFLATLEPGRLAAITPLEPSARRRTEEAIRDALDLDGGVARALDATSALQGRTTGDPVAPWVSEAVLLDHLGCAAPPPPLDRRSARLFVAAIPTLRLELVPTLALEAIPAALGAYALWLRALLGARPRRLGGDDLLSLLGPAMGTCRPLLDNAA